MKKVLYASFLLFFAVSCKNEDKKTSENDIDAVRNFIQAALKGDYQSARTFMIQDSANLNLLQGYERVYISPEERKGLTASTIKIHNVTKQNDSTTIVVYSNSFRNIQDSLRVKRIGGKWLVDFNYRLHHGEDSLNTPPLLNTDTLTK